MISPAIAATVDSGKVGVALVEQLAHGRYDEAIAGFDAKMKQVVSRKQLEDVWAGLTAKAGAYQGHGDPVVSREAGYGIAVVPVHFARDTVGLRVVIDAASHVAGFFIVPPPPAAPPPRELPSSYTERKLTVGADGWPLPATLTLPRGQGPFPAVLLVHGSGPNDRDESVGGTKVFRDLALGLTVRGVAVLRYEKRTRVLGARMAGKPITVQDETVDDAVATVALMQKQPELDARRIFVLGHSLGGSLIPRIGARATGAAGLIVLEGNTRPLEELLVDQIRYIMSVTALPEADKAKAIAEAEDTARQIRDPDLAKRDPKAAIFHAPPSYWLDLRGYRPAEEAARLPQPMLVIQGERDYQVTLKDFAAWKAALSSRKDVTLKTYPRLDHRGVEGEGPSTPASYGPPAHVSEQLIADIASWVLATRH